MTETQKHQSTSENEDTSTENIGEFSFYKGKTDFFKSNQKTEKNNIKITREHISAALNAQRVSFLLGAGCSFPAIPTMSVMLNYFIGVVTPHSFAHLVIKDTNKKERPLGNEDSKVLYEHFIIQGYIIPQDKISDKLKTVLEAEKENTLDLPENYERYRGEITAILRKNNVNPDIFAHLVIKDTDEQEHSLSNEDSKVLYEHFITKGYIISQGKILADKLKTALEAEKENTLDLPENYKRYRDEITAILQKFLDNNYNKIENERILEEKLGIKLEVTENLEDLLGRLYSAQTALEKCPDNLLKDTVKKTIKHIRELILEFVLQKDKDSNTKKSNFKKAIDLYQQFYQKLIFRDRALPRPWIFTTNYDLFNEQAMDRLSIPYCNGFSGVIERYFNPSVFRYSLGQQLDISSRHWEPVDHFVYLCKLHGSISWQESQENTSLFRIKEIQPRESDFFQEGDTSADPAPVLIYPTPMKQSASLGSPYVDLFREFHKQIVCEQSVLFTIGYSFGDEHINNIIFQALTIPNFRLIILIDKDNFKSGILKTLFDEIDDPRIWIISDNDTQTNQGTDKQTEQKAYYFETFIKHFMPVQPKEDSIDEIIRHTFERLKESKKSKN